LMVGRTLIANNEEEMALVFAWPSTRQKRAGAEPSIAMRK
jgi:hypothetical protein